MKLFILMALLFTVNTLHAAIMCPKDSCNPHNGCTEGCPRFTVSGKADCAEVTGIEAEKAAKRNAHALSKEQCAKGSFIVSAWEIDACSNYNYFTVATAKFSCY